MWLEKAIHLRHEKARSLRHETASNLRLQNASQLETIFMISLDKSSALKSWMNSKRSQKHFYGPKLKNSLINRGRYIRKKATNRKYHIVGKF